MSKVALRLYIKYILKRLLIINDVNQYISLRLSSVNSTFINEESWSGSLGFTFQHKLTSRFFMCFNPCDINDMVQCQKTEGRMPKDRKGEHLKVCFKISASTFEVFLLFCFVIVIGLFSCCYQIQSKYYQKNKKSK